MRCHCLAAILTAVTFVPAPPTQKVMGGPDPDRRASTVWVTSDQPRERAGVAISYGAASWQAGYDRAVESPDGIYTRLGKGWWATLDTISTLEIGGTKIEAGCYYLGLGIGKDNAFSLLLFDSKQAMKTGLLPDATPLYRGDVKAELEAPLTLAKGALKDAVVKMEMEITADAKAPATGRLSIRWGKHELSAPVKFHLVRVKSVDDPKK